MPVLQMAALQAEGKPGWQALGDTFKLRVIGKWIDPNVDFPAATESWFHELLVQQLVAASCS